MRQAGDMRVEPFRRCMGVDIEGVVIEVRDRRTGKAAAQSEDQPVVGQGARRPPSPW